MNRLLAYLKNIGKARFTKLSYSQSGEDLIIARILRDLGVKKPFYIDIGANDPVNLSNTYLLYRSGARGILVEPNPTLVKKLSCVRWADRTLGIGIGPKPGTLTYYMFSESAYNTFLESEARANETQGYKVTAKIEVPVKTFADIVSEEKVTHIDLLSVDVEGMDREIIASIDLEKLRPKVICVEIKGLSTATDQSVVEYLKTRGYEVRGLTPINAILVDKHLNK